MSSLYVVMPAYNEEENIEAVVMQWYPVLANGDEKSRLIVADSGSVDRTHEILLELKKTHPQLEIISDCDKQHGPKLIAMYNYAIKNGADYIFQTDSDGQTNPEEFAAFWEKRHEYDGLFGSRPVRGDGQARAFVEKVVCLLLKIYFGVRVPDANAPFRLMKTEVVAKYIGLLPEEYFLPNIMMTMFFVYYKENHRFIDISFEARQAGTNSINVKRIMRIGRQSLVDFAAIKRRMPKVSK